jgi:hypothetical protein
MSPLPIVLHALLALPPSIHFLLLSSAHTPPDPSTIQPILRNYAFNLLSTSAACLAVVLAPEHRERTCFEGALAVYHVAPIWRAVARIMDGGNEQRGTGAGAGAGAPSPTPPTRTRDLGGPYVHLITHVVVMGMLLSDALRGWSA